MRVISLCIDVAKTWADSEWNFRPLRKNHKSRKFSILCATKKYDGDWILHHIRKFTKTKSTKIYISVFREIFERIFRHSSRSASVERTPIFRALKLGRLLKKKSPLKRHLCTRLLDVSTQSWKVFSMGGITWFISWPLCIHICNIIVLKRLLRWQ